MATFAERDGYIAAGTCFAAKWGGTEKMEQRKDLKHEVFMRLHDGGTVGVAAFHAALVHYRARRGAPLPAQPRDRGGAVRLVDASPRGARQRQLADDLGR